TFPSLSHSRMALRMSLPATPFGNESKHLDFAVLSRKDGDPGWTRTNDRQLRRPEEPIGDKRIFRDSHIDLTG
ncbi:MAG: hypothetical protein AAAC48_11945, partial [Phyllobacterium sp.]|uniref:hypothetical protein n=1 Tax=Phyllobacterium sp. TaxID=1871046 RepID=UPI0030EFEFBF